jgi:hypothetical protein
MRVNYAYRCYVCAVMPEWNLERVGDAVCTWACGEHLQTTMRAMQRPWEVSEIRVHPFERRTKVYKRDDGKWIVVCLRCEPRAWDTAEEWDHAWKMARFHVSVWHSENAAPVGQEEVA